MISYLRCACVAAPGHLTPTLDRCLAGLERMKASPEAVGGDSSAIAAMIGAVRSVSGYPRVQNQFQFENKFIIIRHADLRNLMVFSG